MQISLAFSANLLSETPSISPLKGEAIPSKSPKTHPKIRDFRGARKNTPKIKDFSGTPQEHPKNQRFFGDPEKTLYYTAYILQKQKRRHKPPFIFDKTYREELKISLNVIFHSLFRVAKPGLEPRQTEPESVVLPLHHLAKIPRSIRNRRAPISQKRCKITAFF